MREAFGEVTSMWVGTARELGGAGKQRRSDNDATMRLLEDFRAKITQGGCKTNVTLFLRRRRELHPF
jgi:hypothetical protein